VQVSQHWDAIFFKKKQLFAHLQTEIEIVNLWYSEREMNYFPLFIGVPTLLTLPKTIKYQQTDTKI
jgi:hypothetical protein